MSVLISPTFCESLILLSLLVSVQLLTYGSLVPLNSLVFSGRAHIAYTDSTSYKTFNFELPIFHHDQSFLPSFNGPSASSSRPSSSAGESRRDSFHASGAASSADTSTFSHTPPGLTTGQSSASSSGVNLAGLNHTADTRHPQLHAQHSSSRPFHAHSSHSSHTLNAGVHRFPFHITIPGSLPATLRVGGLNTSTISYQLKATVQKSGVFGGKRSVKRPILVVRGLSPEAAEYNQTLEIDNTWPNKIMYNFTLPQKVSSLIIDMIQCYRVCRLTFVCASLPRRFVQGKRYQCKPGELSCR